MRAAAPASRTRARRRASGRRSPVSAGHHGGRAGGRPRPARDGRAAGSARAPCAQREQRRRAVPVDQRGRAGDRDARPRRSRGAGAPTARTARRARARRRGTPPAAARPRSAGSASMPSGVDRRDHDALDAVALGERGAPRRVVVGEVDGAVGLAVQAQGPFRAAPEQVRRRPAAGEEGDQAPRARGADGGRHVPSHLQVDQIDRLSPIGTVRPSSVLLGGLDARSCGSCARARTRARRAPWRASASASRARRSRTF